MSHNHAFNLSIDITYESYYSKKKGLWIHGYKPEEGWIGSSEFVERDIVQGNKHFILHVMPIHVGWNKSKTVLRLLDIISNYVKIKEVLLLEIFTLQKLS